MICPVCPLKNIAGVGRQNVEIFWTMDQTVSNCCWGWCLHFYNKSVSWLFCLCLCVWYEGGDITLVETRAGVLVDLASGNCYDLPQPSLSGELSWKMGNFFSIYETAHIRTSKSLRGTFKRGKMHCSHRVFWLHSGCLWRDSAQSHIYAIIHWEKETLVPEVGIRTHPVWHLVGVREPVVVVEHHDGGDHARRHHEHDAVEVGACQRFKKVSQGSPFDGKKTARSNLHLQLWLFSWNSLL